MLFIGSMIIFIFVALGYAIYDGCFVKHEYVQLRIDEWECTNFKTYYMPVIVGKVTTMMPHEECVNYRRK